MSNSNSAEDISRMNSQQQGLNGPIVHTRADSDSTLEELFSIVTPGSRIKLQTPMKMRNFPPSFFKPPNTGSKSPSCHSRENSVDNTLDPMSPGMQSVGSPQPAQPQQQQQQQPFHSRAHSSPATLQQTLAVAQQQNQHQHLRQASYDISNPDNLGPLPPGWEMAKTDQGQIYFMNHITKTTQWENPRLTAKQSNMQMQMSRPPPPHQQGTSASPQPPKIGASHQRSNSFDSLGPLPAGWEQSVTDEGESYFINHVNKQTTWFDPRIPLNQQSVPIRQQIVPENSIIGSPSTEQKQQQDLRLQSLEKERKLLLQRQEELELERQEKLKRQIKQRSQSQENIMQQTQEMFMRQNLGDSNPVVNTMDPFLSTTSSMVHHHTQGSGDSGVGMGSNFNLGSIPENLPVDMDSTMEVTTDLDSTLTPDNAGNGAGTSNMDTSSSGNNKGQQEDQLIPSLPGELNDVLSNDIMQDVLSSGSNRVSLWL